MKNLVIGSVAVAALSQAAGCIFVTDSNNDALLTAHWELENFVGSTITTCPVGFNTATIISQPVDNQNNPIGAPIFDLFDCEAHGGTISLPPGPYQISISIETDGGSSQYAESIAEIIDLTFDDGSYDTTIFNDAGYLDMGWNFVGDTSNQPLNCSQFLSDGVRSVATNVTTPTSMFTDKFNCEDLGGLTSPVPAGTYNVDIQAFRGTQVIGSAPTLPNVVVDDKNAVTNLGTVTVRMTGM
jgi:hypothetical protein